MLAGRVSDSNRNSWRSNIEYYSLKYSNNSNSSNSTNIWPIPGEKRYFFEHLINFTQNSFIFPTTFDFTKTKKMNVDNFSGKSFNG